MNIKKNLIASSAIVGVLAICLALFSFRAEFAGGNLYHVTNLSGAIVNTENDTVALPSFANNFQLQAQTVGVSVSGTHNVKMYLQASAFRTGTANWQTIDSTTLTTIVPRSIIRTTTPGFRHRLILDGTGTQSSTWTLAVIAKPLK